MDCTTTIEVGGEALTLHVDFTALKRLASGPEPLSLVAAERGLLEFNVVVQTRVLLEALEGGRRLDPSRRPKPWKLSEAEEIVQRFGVMEISKPLHAAMIAAARPVSKDGGDGEPAEGKAPTG